ncbi:putative 6-pyruvoyl-tetrahydropterin synthase (Modular protein) [Nitrospira japonica]|uniref:6-carboxy-5,6,7,8-tetrahydropterin synthase n=1 Tax=Nitrospira japonica TaxID=1325564 RepID=A0A1W1I190_9BACT|nr:6-carboxytetrahydropterin synthase [Nitrospira japonica]SLM46757.1 putative 6-pyruvoyl-tetrahydropterin synthase (Modular protein) [Nitrospira japonica]
MAPVLLTKRIEFAAAHRYFRPEWDEAKNRAVFGRCYNPPAHGHNYMLEVTVSGGVDPQTGMVINLFDLKRVLLGMIEEFDHKNLNLDMSYFTDRIPTSENLARVLWTKLEPQSDIGTLHAIRLYEDEDLFAEITAAGGLDIAGVTRRYSFTAVQEGHQGRQWDCFVTVQGPIDPKTGMVVDIAALNLLVQEHVLAKLDCRDLRDVFGRTSVTGQSLVEFIWTSLVSRIPSGKLAHLQVVHSRDLSFSCSA